MLYDQCISLEEEIKVEEPVKKENKKRISQRITTVKKTEEKKVIANKRTVKKEQKERSISIKTP